MKRIDLSSPTPRDQDLPYSEFAYAIEETQYLPKPSGLPEVSFSKTLASRSSRRTFKRITRKHLNSVLWHSARAIEISSANLPRWQHRPTPSAGGKHPIDLLVFRHERDSNIGFLYQPAAHALGRLKLRSDDLLNEFLFVVNEVLQLQDGTLVWFAAQFDRTLSKYEDGESLVWRDCGALIATMSLVAECLGLNSCAIGITGEPFISQMLSSNGQVVGVGGLIFGKAK